VPWPERLFLELLSGMLSIVVGLLFLQAPLAALAALTLLLACFLVAGGVFKVVTAVAYGLAAWGWSSASGIIDVTLGVMIWQEWPALSPWVFGLFVGIDCCCAASTGSPSGCRCARYPGRRLPESIP
jgi:uncharacterized membrane protein HdeD (DUF308 family)